MSSCIMKLDVFTVFIKVRHLLIRSKKTLCEITGSFEKKIQVLKFENRAGCVWGAGVCKTVDMDCFRCQKVKIRFDNYIYTNTYNKMDVTKLLIKRFTRQCDQNVVNVLVKTKVALL